VLFLSRDREHMYRSILDANRFAKLSEGLVRMIPRQEEKCKAGAKNGIIRLQSDGFSELALRQFEIANLRAVVVREGHVIWWPGQDRS